MENPQGSFPYLQLPTDVKNIIRQSAMQPKVGESRQAYAKRTLPYARTSKLERQILPSIARPISANLPALSLQGHRGTCNSFGLPTIEDCLPKKEEFSIGIIQDALESSEVDPETVQWVCPCMTIEYPFMFGSATMSYFKRDGDWTLREIVERIVDFYSRDATPQEITGSCLVIPIGCNKSIHKYLQPTETTMVTIGSWMDRRQYHGLY